MALTSQDVRERIQEVVNNTGTYTFSVEKVRSLRVALEAYASADGRRFGATAADLKRLGEKLCDLFEQDSDRDENYAKLLEGLPAKTVLATRLLELLNVLFPVGGQQGRTPVNESGGQSRQQLVLQPGELSEVRRFVASLRDGSGTVTSRVPDIQVADSPPQVSQRNDVNTASWSGLLNAAGVSSTSSADTSEGISFWCPLLQHRRGRYRRGPEALAADCAKQIKVVRAWPRPPHSDTVAKVEELRLVLPELAKVSGPMPDIPLHDDVLRLYVHLLETCVKRQNDEAAEVPLVPSTGRKVSGTDLSFGALEIMAPDQPGLDAVSNARFATATSRKVTDVVTDAHVHECVHVVEQFKVFKSAPKPKPLVPLSVRVVIQQSMAPADCRVADAYSIVKGTDDGAERKRTEVKNIMVEVFEKANDVAFERLKRGTAVDRAKRRSLGMQLSARERQASLQRESSALAELRVLARCLSVGESAVTTLRTSRALPQMAQDLIRMQPHLSMSQALSLAKSMLKETPTPRAKVNITRPTKRRREYDDRTQRVVIQLAGGGSQKGQADARGGGVRFAARLQSRQKQRQKPGSGNKACHWCKSTGHLIADCPAKKQGLPRTKSAKKEE